MRQIIVCVVWLPQYIVLHLYLEILTLSSMCKYKSYVHYLLLYFSYFIWSLSLSFGAKLLIQLQKHYDTYVEWNNYTRGLFLYAAVHIALPKENPKQKKLLVVKLFRLWLPKNLFLVLRPSIIINELVILLLLLHK